MRTTMLFDFSKETPPSSWQIVDDVVMGGVSKGNFKIDEFGLGVFSGNVSLENNGGFSSVVHRMQPLDCSNFSGFRIKVKGSGSLYQFRVKSTKSSRYSYSHAFDTTGNWQSIDILFKDMEAVFRGSAVTVPNYSGDPLTEIRILIGNKKPQEFRLLIDKIELF
ncbi:MAG: CIA30 family protein [Leeuwenhoekiella sp.]